MSLPLKVCNIDIRYMRIFYLECVWYGEILCDGALVQVEEDFLINFLLFFLFLFIKMKIINSES